MLEGIEGRGGACFSPSKHCQAMVIDYIKSAKQTIRVQAYSFTDPDIAEALTESKNRGVDVKIILDKSNKRDQHSQMRFVSKRGIPVRIDTKVDIAHNKLILVDDYSVLMGSYNFSRAAYKRNAENVLIIPGRNLSKVYMNNWNHRWEISSHVLVSSK